MPGSLFTKGNRAEPDIKPALMSLAALMMILLPTLLLITTPQKLTAKTLSISGDGQSIPQPTGGVVSSLILSATAEGYLLEAELRKTDVLASSDDIEHKSWIHQEWPEVLETLKQLKTLDPERKRIELRPQLSSTTQQVVGWMDSLQHADRFPEVVISTQDPTP